MQIGKRPLERCERMTLPFDDVPLTPAKAGLKACATKERAS